MEAVAELKIGYKIYQGLQLGFAILGIAGVAAFLAACKLGFIFW